MTMLRDARLHKALACAPDDARPSEATRAAVLEQARRAVARPPWWRQLWRESGERAMPWNAAFATVAVATLVAVLWHAQDVPSPRADAPTPAVVAPAAPVTASAPAQQPATQQPAKLPPAESRVATPPKVAPTTPPAQNKPRQRVGEDAAPAPAAQPRAAELADRVPETSNAAPLAAAAEAAGLRRDNAERAKSAAAAAPPPAAAPAPMQAQLQRSATPGRVLVSAGGTTFELPVDSRAARLAATIGAQARGNEALEAPVDTRIEVRGGAGPADVLELAGAQVRWTHGGSSFTARPDAAALQALREELAKPR